MMLERKSDACAMNECRTLPKLMHQFISETKGKGVGAPLKSIFIFQETLNRETFDENFLMIS